MGFLKTISGRAVAVAGVEVPQGERPEDRGGVEASHFNFPQNEIISWNLVCQFCVYRRKRDFQREAKKSQFHYRISSDGPSRF